VKALALIKAAATKKGYGQPYHPKPPELIVVVSATFPFPTAVSLVTPVVSFTVFQSPRRTEFCKH
jgi:hypothetical protein